MIPDLFTILFADHDSVALLGNSPMRVFPWHRAPQDSASPYVTYGVVSGSPSNGLDGDCGMDNLPTQVDIWADDGDTAIKCFDAIRKAVEPHALLTSFRQPARDPQTDRYRITMEYSFWQKS